MHPLEHNHGAPFLAVPRAPSNSGGDRQGITFGLEEAHLLAASPKLVPRDLNIMDDLVAFNPVRACVGNHRAEQLRLLLVCWDTTGGLRAVVGGQHCVHPAIGQIADVAAGLVAELVVALSGGGHLSDE